MSLEISVEDVVQAIQMPCTLVNEAVLGARSKEIRVNRISRLGSSSATDLSFFLSRDFERELPSANSGILVIAESLVKTLESMGLPLWNKSAVLSCRDPYSAMAILSEKFAAHYSSVAHPPSAHSQKSLDPVQVHPTAVVDPSVTLSEGVKVGAHCVVEKGVKLGRGTLLYPGCFVGVGSELGEFCILFPRVTLYESVRLGNRVRIHAGAVIGADGFGYAPKFGKQGIEKHQKIYHLGGVVLEDDVEIGANSCIDRGTFGDTRIEKGAKIDNLVQIGHNAEVDEGAVICGCTALAGHAHVGKFAYVGGATSIINHVKVGNGCKIGAMTLISKDVPSGKTVVGVPQRDYKEHFKAHAILNKLASERRPK